MRTGVPLPDVARRSGVRTKLGVNMVDLGEPEAARLIEEVRIGREGKPRSQKYSRRAVVGKRW